MNPKLMTFKDFAKHIGVSYSTVRRMSERHEIEIIDVFREPQRALADGVVLTPMLVKVLPGPVRKIIGTLSQTRPALLALDLPA